MLLLVLFVTAAVAIRARDFGNPIIHVDEQYYLLVGDRMLHGALPYVDVWDRKPVGLFLIFAAIRLLPGDGILAYQLVATLIAALTALVISRGGALLGAGRRGAVLAGIAYILWLSFLSGRGGQSPVFYNLLMAVGGVLCLRLPALADRRDRRAILISGTIACALAGIAIQIKYTPAVEGAFFGLAHLWYLRRANARNATTALAAIVWIALGIAPTAIAVIAYRVQGAAAFDAFWFANFTSVALRRGYPAAKIAARLAGTTAQLLALVVCAVFTWRTTERRTVVTVAFAWLAVALVAFAMIGAFFDHYALPLLVPLAIIAAPALERSRVAMALIIVAAIILAAFHLTTEHDDRASARAVAGAMERYDRGECPYVFAGDSALYHLAHACLPTAYAFPSTLAYDPERGATGIDEAAEAARIMARRPPVVVTMDHPLAPWNRASWLAVTPVLLNEYRRVLSVPRERDHLLVYVRRDRLAR